MAQATGRTVDKVRAEAAERGDLGLVAEASKSRQRMMFRPAPLTVAGVFKTLKDIAMMSGQAVSRPRQRQRWCSGWGEMCRVAPLGFDVARAM